MTTKPSKPSLRRLQQELDSAYRQIAGYTEMRKVAETFKMEAELDRIASSLAEWENELESIMYRALAAGYDADDFE